jgi:hypothetical protein
MCTHMYICTHMCTHMYIPKYTYVHAHVHMYTYVYTCVFAYSFSCGVKRSPHQQIVEAIAVDVDCAHGLSELGAKLSVEKVYCNGNHNLMSDIYKRNNAV